MEEAPRGVSYTHAPKRYALSGKIMLSAIVLLFAIVLLILALHIYARCFYLRRLRRNNLRRLRRHRSRILLDHHHNNNNNTTSAAARGLDSAVLASLPIFVFPSKTDHGVVLECAVCLCEFEENEKGRVLPKCNHSFHIDCIDMWFLSHSTCPLCRSPVKSDTLVPLPLEDRGEMVISVGRERDSETGASSSSSGSGSGSDSFRKIEVPMRRGLEEMEIADLKSPGSRILSLKRILSRDRRAGAFSSSSSSGAETDLERGDEQLPQTQS